MCKALDFYFTQLEAQNVNGRLRNVRPRLQIIDGKNVQHELVVDALSRFRVCDTAAVNISLAFVF